MTQTGFKPPVKIIADKDTCKNRTRQLVSRLIVVPDADDLIQPVYLGHPVVRFHSRKGVSESIVEMGSTGPKKMTISDLAQAPLNRCILIYIFQK